MKSKIGWISSFCCLLIGFSLFIFASEKLKTSWQYSLIYADNSYEDKYTLIKILGIILILCGIGYIALKLWQTVFNNKHVQKKASLTQQGEDKKCPNCGLQISVDVSKCPRCGADVRTFNQSNQSKLVLKTCDRCGTVLKGTEAYCPNCGNKIQKGDKEV